MRANSLSFLIVDWGFVGTLITTFWWKCYIPPVKVKTLPVFFLFVVVFLKH